MRYFSLIFLFVMMIPTFAEDDIWTLQEQCVPRAPIGSWSYDGTILATGYSGLHGINADWETPRVMVRTSRYSNGLLSPNQRWYAEFQGYVYYAESFNDLHVIEAITVNSTLGDNNVYSIPWENSWLNMWGYREIFWLNDEQILYEYSDDFVHDLDELRVINILEGTTAKWDSAIDILDGGSGFQREYVQFPSPDFTQTINNSHHPDENRRYWAIYDIDEVKPLAEIETRSEAIFEWLPNSSGFVGEITDADENTSLTYFDKNSNKLATIMTLDRDQVRYPRNLRFASNGRYLAIKIWRGNLLIADMDTHQVIDTCLSTADSITWSPDNSQIAFLEPNSGTQNVYVFDLDSWSYRAVARHIVQSTWDKIIGWRE